MKSTTHAGIFWPADNAEDAAAFVCELCEVDSRKDLDTDVLAGRVFHACIRQPFMVWQAKRVPA